MAEFERARPVRGVASIPGQSHFPGLWWFSSADVHVGFESWLGRDVVMSLDADPDVAAVASQPFWAEPSWPRGTPEAVTADEKSYTGQFLQPLLCQ